MATYKYDVSAISADINKLNVLANKPVGELTIEAQNAGDVINKIKEFIQQLNALHTALNGLVSATAVATQATLNQMMQLDEDFKEIAEEGETIETIYVKIEN